MHHKRKGPKSTRAGCLLCKPHKHQANKGNSGWDNKTAQDIRAKVSEREQKELL